MKYAFFLLIFLFPVCCSSQHLPWYFNTHSFRSWAKENTVHTLVYSDSSSQTSNIYRGISHFANCPPGKPEAGFTEIITDFHVYKLDEEGYVSETRHYWTQLQFSNSAGNRPGVTQDSVSRYMFNLLKNHITSGTFPEKIAETAKPYRMHTQLFQFRAMNGDTLSSCFGGQGIMDSTGVVFRETGMMFIDPVTGITYNYDINLFNIQIFDKNNLVTSNIYSYWPDEYIPITRKEEFVPVKDGISRLKVTGGIAAVTHDAYTVKDSTIVSFYRTASADGLSDSLWSDGGLNTFVSVSEIVPSGNENEEVRIYTLSLKMQDKSSRDDYFSNKDLLLRFLGFTDEFFRQYYLYPTHFIIKTHTVRTAKEVITEYSYRKNTADAWTLLYREKFDKSGRLKDLEKISSIDVKEYEMLGLLSVHPDFGFLIGLRDAENDETKLILPSKKDPAMHIGEQVVQSKNELIIIDALPFIRARDREKYMTRQYSVVR